MDKKFVPAHMTTKKCIKAVPFREMILFSFLVFVSFGKREMVLVVIIRPC